MPDSPNKLNVSDNINMNIGLARYMLDKIVHYP